MRYLRVTISLLTIFALSCMLYAQNMNMQAPAWVNPNKSNPIINEGGYDVYTISLQNPVLQWTPPIVSNTPTVTYIYDLRIVELVEGQAVDYLMESAPTFFKKEGLIVPQIIIPVSVITKFMPGHLYAVQVTAKQKITNTPFGSKSVTIPPISGPIMVFQVHIPKSADGSDISNSK